MSKVLSSAMKMLFQMALIVGGISVMAVAYNFGPMVQLVAAVVALVAVMGVNGTMVRGPPARFSLRSEAGIATSAIVGMVMAFVLLVIGIALADPVMTHSANILGHTNIASFTLVETIVEFLPVIYVVGLFAVAGAIATIGFRRG